MGEAAPPRAAANGRTPRRIGRGGGVSRGYRVAAGCIARNAALDGAEIGDDPDRHGHLRENRRHTDDHGCAGAHYRHCRRDHHHAAAEPAA
eukprot:55161-Eustigmatos_ZCMA.PRE.1